MTNTNLFRKSPTRLALLVSLFLINIKNSTKRYALNRTMINIKKNLPTVGWGTPLPRSLALRPLPHPLPFTKFLDLPLKDKKVYSLICRSCRAHAHAPFVFGLRATFLGPAFWKSWIRACYCYQYHVNLPIFFFNLLYTLPLHKTSKFGGQK